jgi:hypothetical protein
LWEFFIFAIHTLYGGDAKHKDDFMLFVLAMVSHISPDENV